MLVIYGGLFFALFIRIFYIQSSGTVNGQQLEARAAALYGKDAVLTAERGKILDRNGGIIAEDTLSYRLVAVVNPKATVDEDKPRHVIDPEKTAKVLANYISMEESEIYKILTKKLADGRTPYQVEFGVAGRSISHELMTAIKKEELEGITFASDSTRYYPNGPFASHLIGFALKEEQEDGSFHTVGKMGLEYTYNKELTGKNGSMQYESDIFGYLLPNSEKMVTPAENGDDIYLTVDKTIQNFLEESMTDVYKEYNPESMVAVVADPKTGEILAMSQRPTFDPDTREGLDSWNNIVIESVIEPGSTVKTFTLATAIETNNWHPNAFYQSGSYTLYGDTIRDHNLRGWGQITYLEGFQRSSNTAMANMLEYIGNDTLIDYFKKFGFGQKTGIDLPGEASGTLLTNNPIEYVTSSYGQGSTFTPIQLVQAMTAIANDGEMMQPYVIDKIVDSATGDVVKDEKPTVKGNPISKETAKQVREILASTVTSEAGTAKSFAIEGYDVAGKTGTAYIPRTDGSRSYLTGNKNNYLYSFLGMAPADDPQLIVYVAVKKPKLEATEVGSQPVSEVFTSVMQNSLKYLNINPEDVAQVETTKIKDYIGESAEGAKIELENAGVTPIIIGDGGEIIAQYPEKDLAITKGSLVFLKTEGSVTLPSFENWSLRNLLVYKMMSGLSIEIVGEGFVESQSVSENTVIGEGSPIVVQLRTPEETYSAPPIEEETSSDGEELPQD
ncbi:PASTA domain-containing protein [Ureibacillus chungkukjangi]|uniref:Penicillin-binding protein 2B n=1 Tax=Ureibacillus chungkukjangi TaxID=1202712 RepID=A0A318TRR3_9BACL|nr:penicillin-binding protein [Ureibacillus chungkukjangi]PYF07013.1 penicillin-binding protein 2B [Ureibacillus chungkukjangi]